jgi:hypothetical protein
VANEVVVAESSTHDYVALVREEVARKSGLSGPVVGGKMLVEGDSVEAVTRTLLAHPLLWRERPPIVRVPGGARV